MIVYDIPRRMIAAIAESVDLQVEMRNTEEHDDGVRVAASPLPNSTRWLVTDGGYKGNKRYCCIHGYSELIEALLRRYTDATIQTVNTSYLGYDDYITRQPNIMKEIERRFSREICTCDTDGGALGSTSSETSPRAASGG